MSEPIPLTAIHEMVLEFLRDRNDAVVFGAQAVNAYTQDARMTQDVDLLSSRAKDLAYEMCDAIKEKFHIAVRVREIGKGRGYRLFQIRKSGNRHLADIRSIINLPSANRIQGIPVLAPADLIAYKVIAYYRRRGQPKSGTDWRDLAMLLLAFPELKQEIGSVSDCLKTIGADPEAFDVWKDFVVQDIRLPDEEDEF